MTLAERLAAALAHPPEPHAILLTGDLHDGDLVGEDTLLEAAVLVAVTDRPEPGIILTRRTDTLRNHAGQIAFPGGRVDDGDRDVVATALREAHEEIGLSPDTVRVIGTADRYRTVTGFAVTPVVGIVPADLVFAASADEVADVFEVPLAFLIDEANHIEASVEWQGQERHYFEISWGDHRIWGATAAMIVNLARRMRWAL